MAAIERFEDIKAWQVGRELAAETYKLSSLGSFARDHGLRDQIQRASVSVMANVAEGFDSQSSAEFMRFLGYAIRSATEVQSHLYVALDQSYITSEQFSSMYEMAVEAKGLLYGFKRYLRKPKAEGSKH